MGPGLSSATELHQVQQLLEELPPAEVPLPPASSPRLSGPSPPWQKLCPAPTPAGCYQGKPDTGASARSESPAAWTVPIPSGEHPPTRGWPPTPAPTTCQPNSLWSSSSSFTRAFRFLQGMVLISDMKY